MLKARWSAAALLIGLAGVAFPCVAADGPTVSIETVYYDVGGKTPAEIRRQLNKHRPAPEGEGGESYDARAEWDIGWSYTYERAADRCTVSSAEVDLRVTYTLPRWTGADTAKSAMLDRWNRYMAALQRHEEGHKDIAVRTAEKVQQAIETSPAFPCDGIAAGLRARVDEVLKVARQAQVEYDRITRHGETQGARFP